MDAWARGRDTPAGRMDGPMTAEEVWRVPAPTERGYLRAKPEDKMKAEEYFK
jgi:hypothetical protein